MAHEYDEALQNIPEVLNQFHLHLSIYLGHFPQFLGVADNTKENNKHNGLLLHSSSNDEGPGRVSMALLKQHSPPSPLLLPQLTSIHRCHLPYHRVASIRHPCGNSRCQSELRHKHSPLISIPSTLICLPHIHSLIIQGSLYSIQPPKPRPPSSISSINFCIHYLFQQSFVIHPLQMTESSQNIHIYSSAQFSPHTCSCSHYFIPNPIQLRYTSHTPQTFHL